MYLSDRRVASSTRFGSPGARELLPRQRVQDPLGLRVGDRRLAHGLAVGPVHVVEQQPAARAQQSLHEQHGQPIDREVVCPVEVAKVVERLAVARVVGALLDLHLQPPDIGAARVADELDALGDAGALQHGDRRRVPLRARPVHGHDSGARGRHVGGRHPVRCPQVERVARVRRADVVVHPAPLRPGHVGNALDGVRDGLEVHRRAA